MSAAMRHRVMIEVLEPGAVGDARGLQPGDRLAVGEAVAVEDEYFGRLRLLEDLSSAGAAYRRAFSQAVATNALERPSYASFARKARAARPAPPVTDEGPRIAVRVRGEPLHLAGEGRPPGRIFLCGEPAAAAPFIDGRLELFGKPSARFESYVRRIAEYKAALREHPDSDPRYPVY